MHNLLRSSRPTRASRTPQRAEVRHTSVAKTHTPRTAESGWSPGPARPGPEPLHADRYHQRRRSRCLRCSPPTRHTRHIGAACRNLQSHQCFRQLHLSGSSPGSHPTDPTQACHASRGTPSIHSPTRHTRQPDKSNACDATPVSPGSCDDKICRVDYPTVTRHTRRLPGSMPLADTTRQPDKCELHHASRIRIGTCDDPFCRVAHPTATRQPDADPDRCPRRALAW
jgi:hypothetical protein